MRKLRPPESPEMRMWTWERSNLMGRMLSLPRTVSRVESGVGTASRPQLWHPHYTGGPGFGTTDDSAIAAEKSIHR